MIESPKLTLGSYLVAFIDILGQRQLLRQMHGLPKKTDQKEMAEFTALLKKTVGTVIGMRDLFNNYFKGDSKFQFNFSEYTPEQQKILRQLKSNPLKSHMYSDSVILFLALRDDVNKIPVGGVYSALASAATTFLFMLAGGHAMRGGIDIGVGAELQDGEIYGAALSRAYQLENRIAQYPRIVLGDELITYLHSKLATTKGDYFSESNKKIADICFDLIEIDTDGLPFLDYLRKGFKQHIAKKDIHDIVEKAYEFVMKESVRFQEIRDSKLSFRYTLLRNYFEQRMPLWREG